MHKVTLFEDTTFNAMHIDFTQYNQAIPLHWGIPIVEFVDFEDPASFFIDYSDHETVTTPAFSGDRVILYLKFKKLC